jgi:hypothetical protein
MTADLQICMNSDFQVAANLLRLRLRMEIFVGLGWILLEDTLSHGRTVQALFS